MTETTGALTAVRGPAAGSERSLAPDLARGVMLLLIALANSSVYIYGRSYGPRQHVAEGSALDHAWTLVQMTLVDGRAYPMFAALFGYGMVQLADRQLAAGATWPSVRRLLRRRSLWLIVFGFVHTLLLFSGDILGCYGLVGLFVVLLLQARDQRLLRLAAAFAVPALLIGTVMGLEVPDPETRLVAPSLAEADPVRAMIMRLVEWPIASFAQCFLVLTPMLLGIWAARRRVLDEPRDHRRLLRRTAGIGLGCAVLGGLPLALAAAQMWDPPSIWIDLGLGALHTISGTAGGLGYAALIAMAAARFGKRENRLVSALAALGQRSLTFYLAQSVVFVLLFTPCALGLGGRLGSAAVAFLAALTWVATVVAADLLRRAGRRGPAEVLLRRLTYRRPTGNRGGVR